MELQFPFSIATSSLLLLFIYKLVTVLKRSTTTKLPPGPWKLPLIGSIHHLAGSLPHRALYNLSKRFGPLMHLQLGEISAIVVSSPKMAMEVMKTHDLAFANRPDLLAARIVAYEYQNIAFAPYGVYWRQMRKICILELLSSKTVSSFSYIRDDEALKMVDSIRLSLESPINVSQKVFQLTNNVTARAAFGKRCKDQDVLIPLIREMISLGGGFDLSDLFPSVRLLQDISGVRRKLLSLHHKVDKIYQSILDEHQENFARTNMGYGGSGEDDLVDVLLRYQKSADLDCPITADQIKAVILDMFNGGTETASSTMEWAMSLLIKNPQVMKKLQTELRQALKGKKTIYEKDIQGPPKNYLHLVIKETLRLHPPVPLLIPRECREECEIDGYVIPVKTKVIVNAFAIARDPKYWPDAESFIPERFSDGSIGFVGADFQYIPFGAGRRGCPGISFGIANIELPLAQLLYHFDWKLPGEMKPEDLDMSETLGASAGRAKSLYLVATPYAPLLDE